jgi:flagellar basal-body rod protein FlgG
MYTGFHTAASGLTAQSRILDTMGNNIANADSAGYKKDYLVTTTFGEHLEMQNGVNVGNVNFGTRADATYTSFEQGAEISTGRPLDFFIKGEGFFNIIMPDGTVRLTRNGQFSLNQDGFLTDSRGNTVAGQNGPILIGSSDFTVDEAGRIYRDGQYLDVLAVTAPADYNNLDKIDEGYFVNTGAAGENIDFSVIQGSVEASNIDMVQEMADMIASSRNFQSCSRIIKVFDEIMDMAANQVGRL